MSLFGNTAPFKSMFGGKSTSQPSSSSSKQLFSNNRFAPLAEPKSTPESAFGRAPQQSLFGKPNTGATPFGGSATQNVFSQQPAPNPKSVFGSDANRSLFGKPTPTASVFAPNPPTSASTVNPASVFSNAATTPKSEATSIFGKSDSIQSPSSIKDSGPQLHSGRKILFGKTVDVAMTTNHDSDYYSKEEELSPNDLSEFMSEKFTISIPLKPPPKHLCF